MLEHFYESSSHLRQLRQAPFSESINSLASRLYQLGYPGGTVKGFCGS